MLTTDLYRFIVGHVERHGYQPSHDDMADAMGLSKDDLMAQLRDLEAAGLLMLPERERGIVLRQWRRSAATAI